MNKIEQPLEQNLPVSLHLHSGLKPWEVAYFDPKNISKNRYQISDIRNVFRSVSWTLTNLGSICKWKQLTQPASLTLVLCSSLYKLGSLILHCQNVSEKEFMTSFVTQNGPKGERRER